MEDKGILSSTHYRILKQEYEIIKQIKCGSYGAMYEVSMRLTITLTTTSELVGSIF